MNFDDDNEGDQEGKTEPANELHSSYRPPVRRNLSDILKQDASDASLLRYKQELLPSFEPIILDVDDERCVIPKTIHLLIFDKSDIVETVNFSLERSKLEEHTKKEIQLQEGCPYKFRLEYYVQRDIVTGLQLHVNIKKSNALMQHIAVTDKSIYMIGSHAPCLKGNVYESPMEYAPKGLIARGKYIMKCVIFDDYGTEYANWEWTLRIVGKDGSEK
ncbi:hypothetical protein ACOME3_009179 [Neoechinorhynchus agilis]